MYGLQYVGVAYDHVGLVTLTHLRSKGAGVGRLEAHGTQ